MEKKIDMPPFNFNAPDQALEWQSWSKRFNLSLTLYSKKKMNAEKKLAALRLWGGVDFDALIDRLLTNKLTSSAGESEMPIEIPYAPPANYMEEYNDEFEE